MGFSLYFHVRFYKYSVTEFPLSPSVKPPSSPHYKNQAEAQTSQLSNNHVQESCEERVELPPILL